MGQNVPCSLGNKELPWEAPLQPLGWKASRSQAVLTFGSSDCEPDPGDRADTGNVPAFMKRMSTLREADDANKYVTCLMIVGAMKTTKQGEGAEPGCCFV